MTCQLMYNHEHFNPQLSAKNKISLLYTIKNAEMLPDKQYEGLNYRIHENILGVNSL